MAKAKATGQAAPKQEVPSEAGEPPHIDGADIESADQAAPEQDAPFTVDELPRFDGGDFVAVEPLRIDGVDIEPGESFTATADIADPLVASGAARAAE
jgi:hypothetical protein